MRRWVWLCGWFVGCEAGGKGAVDPADDTDPTVEDSGAETDGSNVSRWTWSEHPCAGSRTDTLARLPDGSIWVGCGTTVPGLGLYRSDDEGRSWTAPNTSPPGYFESFRVMDVWLGSDGLLYVAGTNTDNGARAADAVAAILPSADPATVATVVENGRQVWNSFQVGTFRRTVSGVAVAESLTGTDLMWRADDASPWEDGSGWAPDGVNRQILDLETFSDGLYGCGSTIAQPPVVLLPPSTEGDGLRFDVITLDDHDGELWDLHVDGDGVIAVGVDQDDDQGWVFQSSQDPYNADAWTKLSFEQFFPGRSTWADGVCRSGDVVVVVGRMSQTEDAILLRSTDGGARWEDLTPEGVPSLSACHVLADGRFMVAGAQGVFGVYDPR